MVEWEMSLQAHVFEMLGPHAVHQTCETFRQWRVTGVGGSLEVDLEALKKLYLLSLMMISYYFNYVYGCI